MHIETEKSPRAEVRELAAELYAGSRHYLLRIARFNATGEADAEEALQDAFAAFIAEYDSDSGAPALAWITLTMKRRCWRLRDNAHLDRRIGADPDGDHEEPTALIARQPNRSLPIPERLVDRDEARRRLDGLKADERTAIGMVAAGYSYEEIGRVRAWSHTKINRCLYEGRRALRAAS